MATNLKPGDHADVLSLWTSTKLNGSRGLLENNHEEASCWAVQINEKGFKGVNPATLALLNPPTLWRVGRVIDHLQHPTSTFSQPSARTTAS